MQRWTVIATVFLSASAFSTATADPLNIVKLTVIATAAIVLTTTAVIRFARTRQFLIPRAAVTWAALAFLVAMVAATAVADSTSTAVLGQYSRRSGLLLYVCCVVVLLSVLWAFDLPRIPMLVAGVVVTGGFLASYGLLQRAGVDPVGWTTDTNPVVATLGNANFLSGYLGVVTPLALWGALSGRWDRPWRVACGAVAVGCVVVTVLTGSVQGPLAALAGSLLVLVVWLLGRAAAIRRRALAGLGAAVVLGAVVAGAGMAGVGPAAREFEASFRTRQWYWQAAASMVADHPVTGVGMDMYGDYYREHRPLAAVRAIGPQSVVTAAHSVPLHLAASGGLLLGVSYLAVLGSVAVTLAGGLRRLAGAERLLLAGVGGAWVSYVVQSLVSIDQPPLALLHWTLAGATVVAARAVTLTPLRSARPDPNVRVVRTKRGRARRPTPRTATPATTTVSVVAVAAALAAFWVVLRPLRADLAAETAATALAAGDGTAALAKWESATALAPWQGRYWFERARLLEAARRPADALGAYEEALDRDSRSPEYAVTLADLQAKAGDLEAAERLYRLALQVDPLGAQFIVQFGTFELGRGDAPAAARLYEDAVDIIPTNAEWWNVLGDARSQADDFAGARAAYLRALELAPSLTAAAESLARLEAASV